MGVTCGLADNRLQLAIHDNGIGIKPEQVRGTGSLGLVGMRARAGLLGGTVTIHGQPGGGTTIEVSIPTSGQAGE